MLYAVVMAGGAGSRLWPYSRQESPKQLVDLLGPRSLLQETFTRLNRLVPPQRIFIVTGAHLEAATRAQLPDLPPRNIIIEPAARSTAPAIGLAALHIQRLARELGDDAPVMGSFHADHVIFKQAAFEQAVRATEKVAQAGYLVTLGIKPEFAHVGYGYIELGESLSLPGQPDNTADGLPVYHVKQFTEKPSQVVAEEYVAGGRHMWNSGMFTWQVETLMQEYAEFVPEMYQNLQKIAAVLDDPAAVEVAWRDIKSAAIDTAIAERSRRLAVVPADIGWSDVGDWSTIATLITQRQQADGAHLASGAVETEADAQETGNALSLGGARFLGIDTTDSLIFSRRSHTDNDIRRLVATIGLDNYIIVDTDDILLICPRERNQNVKRIVERLKQTGLTEYL